MANGNVEKNQFVNASSQATPTDRDRDGFRDSKLTIRAFRVRGQTGPDHQLC